MDPSEIEEFKELNIYTQHSANKILDKIDDKDPGTSVLLALDISYHNEGVGKHHWEEKNFIVLNELISNWKYVSGILLLNSYNGEADIELVVIPSARYSIAANLSEILVKAKTQCTDFNFELDLLS